MKEIAQTLLILGGFVGLFLAIPAAVLTWFIQRSSAGHLTGNERVAVYSPIICCAAIMIGLAWRRLQNRTSPQRSPGKLTEDGGDSGAS